MGPPQGSGAKAVKHVEIHIPETGTLAEHLLRDEHLPGDHARIWTVSHPGVVLGLRDTRLPFVDEAKGLLVQQGFEVHLRASGGRLVVQDPGVLNVAFAHEGDALPSLEALFAEMTGLLRRLFDDLGVPVQQGEVPGSICAGSTDLSAGGRKIAGLSQRRRRGFALVHAFILAGGRGDEREAVAEAFYRAAGATADEGVFRGSMVSLSELRPVAVERVGERLAEIIEAL